MLRGSNLSDDMGIRLDDSEVVFLSEEVASRFSRSIAWSGDLVFTCWGTVGQIGLIGSESRFPQYLVSNKQMKMTPDSSRAFTLFVYYYLSLPVMVDLVRGEAIGSSVPGFNLGQLKALPVKLPSLAEQRAIAELLEALDDKVAANSRVIAASDRLADGLTTSAFAPTMISLSAVATVTMGSSPPGSSYNEDGIGTPFYQGVRDFGVRFPRRRVWTTSPARLAGATDTLLSVRAPVGRTNLSREKLCLGRGLAGLRSKKGRPMTLFHQIRAANHAWAPY